MARKTRWAWKVYFFLSILPSLGPLLNLGSDDSAIDTYFRILITFRRTYLIQYYGNIASIFCEALGLIPLFLFVFQKKLFNTLVWRIFFVVRCSLLVLGHPYEAKAIRSFFYMDTWTTWVILVLTAGMILPSYIANYLYAFRKEPLAQADIVKNPNS